MCCVFAFFLRNVFQRSQAHFRDSVREWWSDKAVKHDYLYVYEGENPAPLYSLPAFNVAIRSW